ncbi:hypothetical protein RPMA_26660 [Tardiphaga alba]|uniref:Uncharacterized protein n=1 Tax=Tardiphaga alba TaxID=340268 RepID=A0ABX8AE25_9BRAD|nr:hypothetical protein [Tardiphaga alba]QUS42008.1 hypothetical protein RPMA_26660 [Tardiphaga alba]
MRKIVLGLAALATVGFVMPMAITTQAEAKTVIIKKSGGHHHHGGWHRHGPSKKVVIIKHRHRH